MKKPIRFGLLKTMLLKICKFKSRYELENQSCAAVCENPQAH